MKIAAKIKGVSTMKMLACLLAVKVLLIPKYRRLGD
jgi:hypothetical protein